MKHSQELMMELHELVKKRVDAGDYVLVAYEQRHAKMNPLELIEEENKAIMREREFMQKHGITRQDYREWLKRGTVRVKSPAEAMTEIDKWMKRKESNDGK